MKPLAYFLPLVASTFMSAQVTDYHSHCIPQSYISLLTKHGMLLDEGFPLPEWSKDAHLKFMSDAGISSSVLTLPAPQPFFGNQTECNAVCRRLNEEMADIVFSKTSGDESPFSFCATLPLPDVDAAIVEACYALDTLGAVGVKLATNVYGQYLGDSVLDPLMKYLSERHALVILHPHKPYPVNTSVMLQTPLAMQEYLSETTRAVCNMISRNVLARYPNMHVVVPHCGAYLPIALQRMQSLYPVMRKNGLVQEIDFQQNINCLWFDLAGSPSDQTIQSLLSITTSDHLLYGSDYPYVAPEVIVANMPRMQKWLSNDRSGLITRIAEICINEGHMQAYLNAAQKVATESVAKEPGVICIFPMQVKDEPNTIRIVEIYRDNDAYQSHLNTAHFLDYKQSTLHMVKSLRLIDTELLNPQTMPLIFQKF